MTPDRLIHVGVTWDDDRLLWSRSDAPGPRPWEGERPATLSDALDRVITNVQAVEVRLRQSGVTTAIALVEVP